MKRLLTLTLLTLTVVSTWLPAEQGIQLEQVYFDHLPGSSDDALNIRVNWDLDVRAPEWERGKQPFPAAYVRNQTVTVKAVFSAPSHIKTARIGAKQLTGHLGDIPPVTVRFKDDGRSEPVPFPLSSHTPYFITSFQQQWQWYGETADIGTSGNHIYIVLETPQSPWTRFGPAEPWTEVLRYSCTWAKGEITAAGAADEITRRMYMDTGGTYVNWTNYTAGGKSESFWLTAFLNNLDTGSVGDVNCADLGKAVVTFANAAGAGTAYKVSELFGFTTCIRLTGQQWSCDNGYIYHSFAAIRDCIFDASLQADQLGNPPGKPHEAMWMINIPWADYKFHVSFDPAFPYPPLPYYFNIAPPDPGQKRRRAEEQEERKGKNIKRT
jgi:hypothetical protein